MSNLAKLLEKGGALARQGDLAGARALFEKAARDHEGSAEAWANLSAVHGMGGNYTAALRCARTATQLSPQSLHGWINLANAAQCCDELGEAANAFDRACGLPGCPADAILQLGLTLAKLGRPADAEKRLRAYLRRDSWHREATFALARILAGRGEAEAAILAEAYCLRHPDEIQARVRLGAIYLDLGRIDEARRVCDQVMAQSSDAIEALFFKAALLTFEGRYPEARDVYEDIDQLQPGSLRTLILLCHSCRQLGDTESGIAYARAALKIDARSIPAMVALSTAVIMKDPGEARKIMEQAAMLAPDEPSVLALKGRILEFEGDKQGAWECVQAAMERGSMDAETALVAANIAPAVNRMDEAIAWLERLIAADNITSGDKRTLRFALVQVCDKAKQYDRAFEHAIVANRMKNARHNSDARTAEINRLKFVYSAPAIASLPRSSIRSELPVFIVGMPRSGTSLLEQILSCHSDVHARGETMDVSQLVEKIPYYPDGARNLLQEKLDIQASAYLQRLRLIAPDAVRITDKLPGNYMYLGFISQLFPAARVLNCRRDPRDVCLSNFFIEFGAGQTESYSLESMARAYKDYRELMEHWKAVLPIPIMDVQYEELIEQPRAWVESILRFCGLDWEDACLNFHESKRLAVTASYDQVRRPLYKSSVARWKNYARQLEPVSRILGLSDDS